MANFSTSSIAKAMAIAVAMVANLANETNGFYFPGVRPHQFKSEDKVELKVNALTSTHTQIPKGYYTLPFCEPSKIKMASENLGEFITGNKIQNSPYEIHMERDVWCQVLCQVKMSMKDAYKFKTHIKQGYHNNWIIDNLPSASSGKNREGIPQTHYAGGFPIGFMTLKDASAQYYIYNHVNIILDYHQHDKDDGYRVVGFKVEPLSVRHSFSGGYDWDGEAIDGFTKPLETCSAVNHMAKKSIGVSQIVEKDEKIIFTYDVIWKYSEVAWSSRWDIYLTENNLVPAQVHWYSITNSIVVMVFLSILVISILVRSLRRDIALYNSNFALPDEEFGEEADESGWKLIHADVFRPPSTYPMFYAAFVGNGIQILVTVIFSVVLSAVGFVNPARRGSLMISVLVLFMLSGGMAGYVSSRLYKTFRGRSWQRCTLLTATLFPGICYSLFLSFNVLLFFYHSSGCVPFIDVLILAAMWCCISIPLVFIGAYFGYKKEAITFPTVTSTIARALPPTDSSFVTRPMVSIILAGMISFAGAYVELFFIMTSLWMDQYYYVFGFTLLVFFILLITCAEVTVLLVYYQLCRENHRWWWFSFFTGGSVSFYVFAYSCVWFKALEASKILMTYLLYFGYMTILTLAIFLVTGSVGALISLWFVRKIFSTIKVD